jgi:putative membrane protein
MRMFLGVILLVFLGAVGVFALQNTQAITVQFITWSVTAPLAFLAVVIYLLGMLSGSSVVGFVRRSIRGVSSDRVRR